MSHNGYVQGLLENGCQLDIIMASDSWGKEDAAMPVWPDVSYHCFCSVSFRDRLRNWVHDLIPSERSRTEDTSIQKLERDQVKDAEQPGLSARSVVKKLFYTIMPSDPLYPLEHAWLKRAVHFKSRTHYDLVISNSSPAAGHKLVDLLSKEKQISYDTWVQIWEDPWYSDLYGGHSDTVKDEEHDLLRAGQKIFYVSPLTLKYQKRLFPDCAFKMNWIPLPYLKFSDNTPENRNNWSFGYFGDYYLNVRNLIPFYTALRQAGARGFIFGDSNANLECTENITVNGRVTLDILAAVQKKTGVLVHLCNLRGGQIPGKVYHYSATNKPILFILDGTEEEQKEIRAYFERFDRYYFCENTVSSILTALEMIRRDMNSGKIWIPVNDFSPKAVAAKLIEQVR